MGCWPLWCGNQNILGEQVNIMADDAQVPFVTKPSAAIALNYAGFQGKYKALIVKYYWKTKTCK